MRNTHETHSLKSLANGVLARNSQRNIDKTSIKNDVSSIPAHETDDDRCFYHSYYDERVAIAQYDGKQIHEHAKAIAHRDTVEAWIFRNPPMNISLHTCAFCHIPLDAAKGGHIAFGDVYCCYHDAQHHHLAHYISSRRKEAQDYLSSIRIFMPKEDKIT